MLKLEQQWYKKTRLQWLLYPISLLFRALVAIRRVLYRDQILNSDQLLLPVIVIGNISVGGTGKTPLTLALAQQLIEHGWHPLIISRGYGGAARQPRYIRDNSDAQQVGDEPLMMARRKVCPVWIGKDRVATAQAALQDQPLCDVVLCDDGLQHYRLQRDFEIAVVDVERGFGNGRMLPAGPLREPISRLKTVDAVVMNGGVAAPDVYAMHLVGDTFYNLLDADRKAVAADFLNQHIHAVAGIGNPQRFFQHLQALDIAFTPHAFPDHHPYAASDLAFNDCQAILLTEKDAVKCTAFADARYWVLPVNAHIDATLIDNILRKIAPHGH